MPTFETPIPQIEHSPFVEQIPMDALFRGLGYKQGQYDQAYQAMQQQADAFANVKAYGPDQEPLRKIQDAFNQGLSQFRGSLLTDNSTRAKLNDLVSSTSQALWRSGIPIRTAQRDKMEADAKAMRDKGKQGYFNGGLDSARKYELNGQFDPSTRFNDAPGEAPDVEKIVKTVHEAVTPDKINYTDPATHEVTPMEFWDPRKVRPVVQSLLKSHPDWSNYVDYQRDLNNPSGDWSSYADQAVLSAKTALTHASQMYAAAPTAQQKVFWQDKINDYNKDINDYSKLRSQLQSGDPTTISLVKAHAAKNTAREFEDNLIEGFNTLQQLEPKMLEYYKVLEQEQARTDADKSINLDKAGVDEQAITGGLTWDEDTQTYTRKPGPVAAKPSSRQVTVGGNLVDAPEVVQSIEGVFDGRNDIGTSGLIKKIITDGTAYKEAPWLVQLKLNPNGTIQAYIPEDKDKPDGKIKAVIGNYTKSDIYSMTHQNLNKEVEQYKAAKLNTFPKVQYKGQQVPVIPSNELGWVPPGATVVLADSSSLGSAGSVFVKQ